MKAELFAKIDIWKRMSENQLFCYRVFQRLSDSKYCVQSKDGFSPPFATETFTMHSRQLVELFLEIPLEDRERFYPTIEKAIEAFDADFR